MILTLFGDLQYGSQSGLSDWVAAHKYVHDLEVQTLAYQSPTGVVIASTLLTGDVTADWMMRNLFQHMTVLQLGNYDATGALDAIANGDWSTEEQFKDWHAAHDYLHLLQDTVLGIV